MTAVPPSVVPVAAPPAAAPVAEAERIGAIDVLRGVAVLGILLLNVQSFAMPGAAYMNPTAFGDLTGANYVVWRCTHLLGDQKFMSIFSMLFGAGVILMTSRAEARTGRSAAIHYSRMGWLILFGLVHAYALWYGDILYTYGMCGLAVYLVRRWPAAVLVPLAIVLLAIPSLISLGIGGPLAEGHWPPEAVEALALDWTPDAEHLAGEIDAYRSGWWGQMGHRAETALFFQTFLFVFGFGARAASMMLLGMALFKLRVLTAQRSAGFYAAMAVLCLGAGLPLIDLGIRRHEAHGWAIEYSFFLGSQFNYWGSVPVALGYVALVMLACRLLGAGSPLLRPLGAAGRMAFTNYIAQTVICTTIFYGHGFGRFGSFERIDQLAVVLAVWAATLIWSPIWLRFFRFGPLEWGWRALTYCHKPPMRRVRPDGARGDNMSAAAG
jgi:uncharacterized protein